MNQNKIMTVLMCLSMSIWGISWSSAKVLSRYGDAANIAHIRFVIVLIVLGVILKVAKIPFGFSKANWIPMIGASLSTVTYSVLFFYALKIGKSGAGGVLVTTMIPLFSYLIGMIFFGFKTKSKDAGALLLGAISCGLMIEAWNIEEFSVAMGIFLICALLWAVMTKFTAMSRGACHPLAFSFWIHAITVAIMFVFVPLSESQRILVSGDSLFWGNMLYFGIINSAGATTTYLFITTKIGAEKATSFVYLVPLGAVLSSWAFLDEQPLWNTLLGGVLGVAAVMILQKKSSS
jgi:drug/metabolite transporter (DMT)-like permease